MKNERGEFVNDRMRPDTFADYFEKVQWARNEQIDHQRQEAPDSEPIYDTEAEVKQDLHKGRIQRSSKQTEEQQDTGPNGVTSELIKLLDEGAREKLLGLLNICWEEEELFEDMNQADLAVIHKKGKTEQPGNYRPIALFNMGYKLMASMTQKRL